MPIRKTLSDLLTFDITIDNGPISDALGIDWSFSLSSDLDFTGPSGLQYSRSASFESSSDARDIALSDSFAFFFDGPQSDTGFAYGEQNQWSTLYESYRGTSVENYGQNYAMVDGSPAVQAEYYEFFDSTVLGRDILPAIEVGDFLFS